MEWGAACGTPVGSCSASLCSASYVKQLLRRLLLERPVVPYNLKMEERPGKGKHTQPMQMISNLYQPILLHHETRKKITQDIQKRTCMQSNMSHNPLFKTRHKMTMQHALYTTTIALIRSCD